MSIAISIITVNFNNKQGLQKTIESVVGQTSRNFEFIIIDGGSTDGSTDCIALYQADLTYSVSEPDNGIYHAMNKGIRQANGLYLLFLNSGDTLADTTVLENVEPYLLPDHIDILYGDAAYLEPGGKVIRKYPKELSFGFFLEQNLSHQASFIRRSLFSDLFFYNEKNKIVSDWEFLMYAICKANRSYQHIDLVICDYDVSGISSLTDNHPDMYEERERAINKHFPLMVYDYEKVKLLESKRLQQFFYIKNYKFAYKILKGLMSLLLLFLPKRNFKIKE